MALARVMGESADHAGILLRTMDAHQAPPALRAILGGKFHNYRSSRQRDLWCRQRHSSSVSNFCSCVGIKGWLEAVRALRRFENQLALLIVSLLF